ncbi:ninein-like [Saccostrea echinata]|uniref:ninein-like n=1 Tax=Saccostrea echinata TaxID=191078 RepID=UPI002A80F076|nr:ninein-like [Saccostrea echinata]
MNVDEVEDVDLYIAQLKEVFDSCDIYHRGYLSRSELLALCHKLQLDEQAEDIVDHLIDNAECDEIDFEHFKENFVNILCQSTIERVEQQNDVSLSASIHEQFMDADQFEDAEDEESDDLHEEEGEEENEGVEKHQEEETKEENSPRDTPEFLDLQEEVTPKYVQGNKRYGRRSRPFQPEDFEEFMNTNAESEKVISSQNTQPEKLTSEKDRVHKKPPLPPRKGTQHTESKNKDDEETGDPGSPRRQEEEGGEEESDGEVEKEMFEAEGQMNLNMSELEQAQEISGHEEYLRNIWKTLNVGRGGYITAQELGQVCDHIGMEMNKNELQQLFDRLDQDSDGRISFEDFVGGVFQHNNGGATSQSRSRVGTPRSLTPRTHSAQKKFRPTASGAEERTTPSLISGSGSSGLFTVLDTEHTGFAMPDSIIDLWEKYSITDGADILLALGFDLVTRISLLDLSYLLEQEMMAADEENAIYQAAFASYQQEIIHIKSSLEQQMWATDKLKQDLTEANSRNALLAKEVDERHLQIEQSTEKKLSSIEKKYQEQLRGLQTELEQERAQVSSLKNGLDSEKERIEEEEKSLRFRLMSTQKDMEKMEAELVETNEKLAESEKLNTKLQKDFERVVELQQKWEEYEASDLMTPEQQRSHQEKLTRTTSENQRLKDMNDELTAQVLELQQQIYSRNKSEHLGSQTPNFGSRIPIREGSFLSDYVKTKRGVRSSVSSENSEDEGLHIPNHPGRVRRRLPLAPADDDDTCSVSSIQSDRDYIEILKKEITDLKIHNEREKKDLEQSHRNEILQLEEKFQTEKEELQKSHRNEMLQLEEKYKGEKEELQQSHRNEIIRLEEKYQSEKEELGQKFKKEQDKLLKENEKNLQNDFQTKMEEKEREFSSAQKAMEEDFQKEKQKIIDSLQEEYKRELQAQVSQMESESKKDKDLEVKLACSLEEIQKMVQERNDLQEQLAFQKEEFLAQYEQEQSELKDELESTLMGTESAIKKLETEKVQLSMKIEDMSQQFEWEKLKIQEEFEKELQKQENEYRRDLQDFENIFAQGEVALKGKLRDDFYELLEKHKKDITETEKEAMMKDLQKERLAMEKVFAHQKNQLDKGHEKEKEELVKKYEEQVQFLRQQLHNLEDKMESEREAMSRKYEEEKEGLEEELACAIREELKRHKERQRRMAKQDEYVSQMEKLQETYNQERKQLMQQINVLQQELDTVYKEFNKESKPSKKVEELNRTITALQKDKKLAEKAQSELQKALQMTKAAMETRISEIDEEKASAVKAVRVELVQASKEAGKQKATLDAVNREKKLLEKSLEKLQKEMSEMQREARQISDLQGKVTSLEEENMSLLEESRKLKFELKQFQTTVIPAHAQHVIDKLQERNTFLEETLSSAQHKLTRVDDQVDKLAHPKPEHNNNSHESNKKLAEKMDSLNAHETDESANHLYKEREKMQALQLEKGRLEEELRKVTQMLEEATSDLAKFQSQHAQYVKGRPSSPVDIENFTKLQIDLVDQQRQLRELQELMDNKENEKCRKFRVKEDERKRLIQSFEEEKANLTRKLKLTEKMLDEQLEKINAHYAECEKRNILVVDLYKENADLMEALYLMEERKKDAVSRCYRLEDQCKVLRLMLKKVCHVAVA